MNILTKIRAFALWARRKPVDALEPKADSEAVRIDAVDTNEATEADARFVQYVTSALSDIVNTHCAAMVQPGIGHLPKMAADLRTLASLIELREG